MKKFAIVVIALAMLVVGMAAADRGVDATYETQGILTSVTINAVGNFESHSDIGWEQVDGLAPAGILPVPPLIATEAYYTSSYQADTVSLGVGLINFDRETQIESANRLLGQSNIEAVQVLGYYGIDAGRVTSTEEIMVDGAANPYPANLAQACPFAALAAPNGVPAYCNRAQAGSSIDMSIVSVRTDSNDRFVLRNSDIPVELNHNIRVSDFAGVPSMGSAEAHIDVLVREARTGTNGGGGGAVNIPSNRIEFHERTSVDGEISLFERLQHYESGAVR